MKLFLFEINDGEAVSFGDMVANKKEEVEKRLDEMMLRKGKQMYFFDVEEVEEVDDYHIIVTQERRENRKKDKDDLFFIAYYDNDEKYYIADYIAAKDEDEIPLKLHKERGKDVNKLNQFVCNKVSDFGQYKVVLFEKEA